VRLEEEAVVARRGELTSGQELESDGAEQRQLFHPPSKGVASAFHVAYCCMIIIQDKIQHCLPNTLAHQLLLWMHTPLTPSNRALLHSNCSAMERASKRKAAAVSASPAQDSRAAKRQKTPVSVHVARDLDLLVVASPQGLALEGGGCKVDPTSATDRELVARSTLRHLATSLKPSLRSPHIAHIFAEDAITSPGTLTDSARFFSFDL